MFSVRDLWDLRTENIKELKYLLQNEKWEFLMCKSRDVNNNYEKFNTRFIYNLNVAYPLIRTKKRKHTWRRICV